MSEAKLPMPVRTWSASWLAWRDRCLSSPRFQHWAAAFPLTRWIARRRARAVFDLVAGFVYSQVLCACVRLHLFDRLAHQGPLSLSELARQLDLPEPAALRLLDAAVALRLVERRTGECYGLGVLGAPLVGHQGIAAMVEHHHALYADLHDPVALLRGQSQDGELSHYWPYALADSPAALGAGRVQAYTRLMSASQPLVAQQVLDAYSMARHQRLLDVGGGDGTFLRTVAQRWAHLDLMLFDLPAVAEQAKARLAHSDMAARCAIHGGDFWRDPLPQGADLATLVRVVHDHDDEPAMQLLKAVRQALPAHGRLLLAEPMARTAGAETMGDAYFGFYLLAMGSGRPRSAQALTAMLQAAGFQQVRRLRTHLPLQVQVLLAQAS